MSGTRVSYVVLAVMQDCITSSFIYFFLAFFCFFCCLFLLLMVSCAYTNACILQASLPMPDCHLLTDHSAAYCSVSYGMLELSNIVLSIF